MRICVCDTPRKRDGWSQGPSWWIPSSFLPVSQFWFRAKILKSCVCSLLFSFLSFNVQPFNSLFLCLMTWTLHNEMAASENSKQPESLNHCMKDHHLEGPLTFTRIHIGEIKLCCAKPPRFVGLLVTGALLGLSWLIYPWWETQKYFAMCWTYFQDPTHLGDIKILTSWGT